MQISCDTRSADRYSGKALNLHLEGTRFKSRLDYRLSWTSCFM